MKIEASDVTTLDYPYPGWCLEKIIGRGISVKTWTEVGRNPDVFGSQYLPSMENALISLNPRRSAEFCWQNPVEYDQ